MERIRRKDEFLSMKWLNIQYNRSFYLTLNKSFPCKFFIRFSVILHRILVSWALTTPSKGTQFLKLNFLTFQIIKYLIPTH